MERIGQRELRNASGEVLRRVAAGETILVTDGGVPAALLSPVPSTRRERLILAGRLRPATAPLDVGALPPRIRSPLRTDDVVADDRGHR